MSWLLDHCPADYRLYAGWRRYPVALAWLASRHVKAQLVAMRQAYREVRVELVDDIPPEAIVEVLRGIEREGVRLLAAEPEAFALIHDALQGKSFVPRL